MTEKDKADEKFHYRNISNYQYGLYLERKQKCREIHRRLKKKYLIHFIVLDESEDLSRWNDTLLEGVPPELFKEHKFMEGL